MEGESSYRAPSFIDRSAHPHRKCLCGPGVVAIGNCGTVSGSPQNCRKALATVAYYPVGWPHDSHRGSDDSSCSLLRAPAQLADREKRPHAPRVDRTSASATADHRQFIDDVPRPRSTRLAAKKKSLSASERNRPEVTEARELFRASVTSFAVEDLVFVDESGVTTTMTRLYGRAPKGQRVPEAVPHGHWKILTILGAMSITGIQAALTVDAATDADIFTTFLEQALGPTLRPGQVVILDNLSAHKQERARELIEARGCRLWYLPP